MTFAEVALILGAAAASGFMWGLASAVVRNLIPTRHRHNYRWDGAEPAGYDFVQHATCASCGKAKVRYM